ncbi:unnamed protein product [Prunus armeniaca]
MREREIHLEGFKKQLPVSLTVKKGRKEGIKDVDSVFDTEAQNGVLDNSADVELRLNHDGAILATCVVEEASSLGQIEQVSQNSSRVEQNAVEGDEPYLGQEFDSEAAAHAFYNAYALRIGFRTRVNDLSRSRVDGSIIARTLVCNKEGYRVADKRERMSVRPRPPTRVGCKAMISVKKLSIGKWVVAKFVKEHTHTLSPGKGKKGSNDQSTTDEQMKIKELTQQLLVERKRGMSRITIRDVILRAVGRQCHARENRAVHINRTTRPMDSELDKNINDGVLNDSSDAELKHSNDGALVGSFVEVEEMSHLGQGQDDEVTQNPCKDGSSVVVEADEPYVGQEFDTEITAQAFYNAYGMRVGFMTRMNYLARSKHDGTIIGRTFVCNKEGYRKPDRRDKTTIKPRAPTRVGCKAMLSIKKISIGKWVVTRFMKEHTHALTATANKGQKGLIADQVPDDKRKIEELTRELFLERKRSASLREIVDLLFDHIEEHTQDLSKKVQYVVDKVREIESEGKKRYNLR